MVFTGKRSWTAPMSKSRELTVDRARDKLDYDPATGIFTRKITSCGRGWQRSGRTGFDSGRGYIKVFLDGRVYFAHRLAWFVTYGAWPDYEIDHINGDRSDNRLCNLRVATSSQNKARSERNGKSGLPRGVKKHHNRYSSRIRIGGKEQYLGMFESAEEAHAAYCAASVAIYREFAWGA